MGLPAGTGLFSQLQLSLGGCPECIPINKYLRMALEDWKTIIKFMRRIPTSVLQLTPAYPHYIGYCDACHLGMGGIWCPGKDSPGYGVWQVRLPQDIAANLHSQSNPQGTITINDLELAAIVIHYLTLSMISPSLALKHIAIFCDNTSAVA